MDDMGESLAIQEGAPEDVEIEPLPVTEEEEVVSREAALPVLLDRNARQAFLGRLAEFEMKLVAMPDRMQAFCLAYIADPSNATAAARKAGYSTASCAIRASQLLVRRDVQALVSLGLQLREDRTMLTSDRTLNELAIIAFSSIGDYDIDPSSQQLRTRDGVPEYAMRAVASAEFSSTVRESEDGGTTTTYKTKIKLWPKTEALRLLAVYQKLLTDGAPNVVVNNDNRGQTHNYQHNTWQIGDRTVVF